MTFNFYDSLNQLVTDSRFRSLAVTQNFENFLNTSGINESENMHTLSWLLTPNGSHGLNDVFMKELMTYAWTIVNGKYDYFKASTYFNNFSKLSPVTFQQTTYTQAFINRDYSKNYPCADMVITDVNSKTMLVINNKYNNGNCDKAVSYFTSDKYNYFENKAFISFDASSTKDSKWIHMNNEWLINLCTNLIDCPQYNNAKISYFLKDYYQFLTGCQYGVSHNYMSECTASLMSDYYEVFNALKTFKAEKVSDVAVYDITPTDYATLYFGKFSEKEYGVLSLCWAYRNTFNTFFNVTNLENVKRSLETKIEKMPYSFESTFVRNGLRFTPCFEKVRSDKFFMNSLFSVEMIQDNNKNLCMNMVVNKTSWDKLNTVQRMAFQKEFGFTTVLKDQMVVWNKFYGQTFKHDELCQEINNVFGKIETYLSNISFKVA